MEKRAKNVETAIDLALAEMGVTRDKVEVKVIDEGTKGFLGLGAKEAVVEVTLKQEKKTAKSVSAKKTAVKEENTNEENNKPKPRERKEVKPLTEEVAALATEIATKFLSEIFEAMAIDVKINVSVENEDTLLVHLDGENIGIVIGKRGDTLDALQYLTSLVVNKKSDSYIKVTLDTENYREKRTEALLALAQRLASKVAYSGRKFTLEPMNPYERRIIHAALQSSEEVTTYSIGQEPYRKVVIAPKNPKPRKSKNSYDSKKKSYTKKENVSVVTDDASGEQAEKRGSYTTTYKADFKPQQHKAQYASYEEYLAAQKAEKED